MENSVPTFFVPEVSSHLHGIKVHYNKTGIIKISEFLDTQTLMNIKQELIFIEKDAIYDLETNWQNQRLCFFSRDAKNQPVIKQDFATKPYFLSSAKKTHIFYESIDNHLFVNRIGHGLHLNPCYEYIYKIVYNNKLLHQLLQITGLQRPICHLSVYIPKYPHGIGSEVRPHQESTFVHTNPLTTTVLWIALEDASIENACMWGVLGSNHYPLKYVSMVDHKNKVRKFKSISNVKIPDFDLDRNYYTALQVKGGDALLFHGNFIHCSPNNFSNRSRKALSMQFIDTLNVHYSHFNWLTEPNTNYLYDLSGD